MSKNAKNAIDQTNILEQALREIARTPGGADVIGEALVRMKEEWDTALEERDDLQRKGKKADSREHKDIELKIVRIGLINSALHHSLSSS
jgi:hypothetical protein